jgi:hypothetical protein
MAGTLKILAGAIALLGITASLTGCADVNPWDRGRLAKPYMALDNDPIRHAANTHVNSSREGTAGGGSAEGGGCGCY